jgi:hypothetical protein
MKFVILPLTFFASVCSASNLAMTLQTDDLKIKGEFTFTLGSPLVITGNDANGISYILKIDSIDKGNDFATLRFHFNRNGHVESGSIVEKFGETATLTSGTNGQEEKQIRFEVKLVE